MVFDVIIRGGRVVDGTGNLWFKADIGVSEGRIARLSRTPLNGADRVIDAKGLLVCPGFINLHSHSGRMILNHNNAENCLAMGLVTELVGSCGYSMAPITEAHRSELNEIWAGMSWNQMDEEIDWLTLSEWRSRLDEKGIGVNIAPLVGHGTVRSCVNGKEGEGGERVVPSDDEMAGMIGMVEAAMEDGAFGLSTGLVYAPGRNSLTGEIVELARVVSGYGGLYSSHMRCEADRLIEATREMIEICERAGVRGLISHHKAMGWRNYGKVNETLRMVDRARARGVDIIIDEYPYQHGGTIKSLGRMFKGKLPDGSAIETREELLERLKDDEEWERVKASVMEKRAREMEMHVARRKEMEERGGWTTIPSSIVESDYIIHSRSHPELEGKTLEEVAEAFGEEDVLDCIRELLIADDGYTLSEIYPYSEDDVVTIMRYPWTTISTDQYAMDNSKVSWQMTADALLIQNPRGWGTYPRILGRYVRERSVLTLDDAIRKMTSLPAMFLGLQGRGLVKEGFWADLVVLDPDTVGDRATYADPFMRPEGIPYVLVNGELAVDKGEFTEALAGKVLRNPFYP
ncbi:MAG: amidohydrolase family protein [Candidatus Bathyarchaeota archaeon]|nr:MAG: amidohydrolase family protein [Candidatus Bathyarchaeota archaeon]